MSLLPILRLTWKAHIVKTVLESPWGRHHAGHRHILFSGNRWPFLWLGTRGSSWCTLRCQRTRKPCIFNIGVFNEGVASRAGGLREGSSSRGQQSPAPLSLMCMWVSTPSLFVKVLSLKCAYDATLHFSTAVLKIIHSSEFIKGKQKAVLKKAKYMIYFAVYLKLTHCKSTILQYKIKWIHDILIPSFIKQVNA